MLQQQEIVVILFQQECKLPSEGELQNQFDL